MKLSLEIKVHPYFIFRIVTLTIWIFNYAWTMTYKTYVGEPERGIIYIDKIQKNK